MSMGYNGTNECLFLISNGEGWEKGVHEKRKRKKKLLRRMCSLCTHLTTQKHTHTPQNRLRVKAIHSDFFFFVYFYSVSCTHL